MNYILMNVDMASAILRGKKTQSRRVVKKFYNLVDGNKKPTCTELPSDLEFKNFQGYGYPCPLFYSKRQKEYYCGENIKYKVGEKIWVREPAVVTNYISRFHATKIDYKLKSDKKKQYRIVLPDRFFPNPKKWIINCESVPNGCIKEMARIFLVITSVRVEKLQDITIEDMLKEGIELNNIDTLIEESMILNLSQTSSFKYLTTVEIAIKNSFIELWNKTSPKGHKWEDNPYVFVYQTVKKEKGELK